MASIYIHIPFCKQACHYCNFHFATSLRYKNELVAALLKELGLQKNFLQASPVESIYFGGGTPSLCTIEEVQHIIETVRSLYNVTKEAELTLEANPDDITGEKLIGWKNAGINRLSIGIQSFFKEDLKWMNRAHNARQAHDNLLLATKHFDNITIDLIYGTPALTNEKWKQNVETAILMGIQHLSCYALTVEPKTPLDKLIRQQKSAGINPDKQAEQFLLLMQWLSDAGYEHYEISNFARPGQRSRHNSSYWRGEKYLGIGPSAHSFSANERQWNIANNVAYIESISKGIIPCEKEQLTSTQQLNEYIMISLRTSEGLSLKKINSDAAIKLKAVAQKYIDAGLMLFENDCFVLTNEGKLLADGIAASLFF